MSKKKEIGKISAEWIKAYAEASGDFNPIHLDLNFAKESGLPKRIAHGMLGMSICSSALPELGLPLEKLERIDSKFKDKIFEDDEVYVELLKSDEDQAEIVLRKANGDAVLELTARFKR